MLVTLFKLVREMLAGDAEMQMRFQNENLNLENCIVISQFAAGPWSPDFQWYVFRP